MILHNPANKQAPTDALTAGAVMGPKASTACLRKYGVASPVTTEIMEFRDLQYVQCSNQIQ